MSREILVRGPNWLGDLVMCTPAFRALREAFPDDRISLHVREELLPLVAGTPWFDAALPVRSYHRGALAMLSEARSLRAGHRFDLGICIPDSWSSALLMRAAAVRQVVGFAHAGRGWLLHDSPAPPPGAGPRNWVARERHALALVEAAGAPARGTQLQLFTTPEEEDRASSALAARGLVDGGFVAVAPGASYGSAKCWPPASFARVADDAIERGLSVCLIGAAGERALVGEVAAQMRQAPIDLSGALDLGALKAVLRRSRVLVCNDAGARHVAVAFGVPCVVLMGPTSLLKTDCNLERVRVIDTNVDCRPCYERVCPIDHRCMTRIAPERVSAAVAEIVAADPREEPPEEPEEGRSPGGRRGAENAGT
jgi:heptosyltransferase-2